MLPVYIAEVVSAVFFHNVKKRVAKYSTCSLVEMIMSIGTERNVVESRLNPLDSVT
jgi:hypothetical protein